MHNIFYSIYKNSKNPIIQKSLNLEKSIEKSPIIGKISWVSYWFTLFQINRFIKLSFHLQQMYNLPNLSVKILLPEFEALDGYAFHGAGGI